MRTAVADGNAEALGAAHGNVGAHLTGGLEQAQRQRVGDDDTDRAVLVQRLHLGAEVAQAPTGAGVLEDRAEDLLRLQHLGRANDHLDPQRLGPGAEHGDVLRVAVFIDEEGHGLGLGDPLRHGHGFGRCGGFIEQRGVGDFQTCEVGDHGLEVEQCLQTALTDLRLIGRISRVPGRVFQHVTLDHRRGDGPMVALPDQRGHDAVLRSNLAHVGKESLLGQGFAEVQWLRLPDACRDRLPQQGLQIRDPKPVQHRVHLAGGRADMTAVGKIVGLVRRRFESHGNLVSREG